ncbi:MULTISPECIES: ABC-ATPase domain-containing protein [Staphylococcus]|uniref:ABC-ATPase domain-containing protein n=1 Tax=Staphylococcus borealis TaxID=2742203 RepID=A0ABX2LMQ0_9STAP|nr:MULTISPECIES: ABC-ATPase domain-containing protein [Staphylococcus]OLF32642.1 ATPase [Staphylococcus aureus]MDO0993795.1 ABC-ATPase domain-containing protein [Staphylococcus borealis]MUN94334.1 ATPase [Staphylococcus borealis]NUI79275.1 ABC-ATPase domain-containing protein [Staphylococcus borealis]NUI81784.1 ABC-ATPase domain-containing protein [Staphylococcus borealis]
MKRSTDLDKTLKSLDGQKYGAYKRIKGTYAFNQFRLAIDHVQVDPFAPPSKMRLMIQRDVAQIPDHLLDTKDKRLAVSDFLTRAFAYQVATFNRTVKGSGKNGKIFINHCGQEMLERTSVVINDKTIEVRFEVGMPAAGRKILGKAAAHTLINGLPKIVNQAIMYQNIDQQALQHQVTVKLDQTYIREQLEQQHLVAFVANNAILPRKSGVSDEPMKDAIRFTSPTTLETTFNLPSGRAVTGMSIPEGITLIVGGGYHGKSTLLEALERSVYDHIPNDGREFVITRHDAMKIRAEDGRGIHNVNISPFIDNLPGKKDTTHFSTENASGSTSQAANVMEALETQTSTLLIDEDTSATNFMIRDGRMQKLIAPDKEPITPFSNKVRPLFETHHVSTILIVGGSGDYFDVADQVLMMDAYHLKDVTDEAKAIAQSDGYQRDTQADTPFGEIPSRVPLVTSFSKKGKDDRLKAKGLHTVMYGKEAIDLSGLEQLVDDSQTNALPVMINYFRHQLIDHHLSLIEATNQMYEVIEKHGIEAVSNFDGHPGNLALPRKQEFIGTLNRYRGLKVK